jgi:hypothetical protein
MAVRGVMAPLFVGVRDQLLQYVHSACQAIPGACPEDGKLQISALPPKDAWIERAIACRRGPLLDRQAYANAAAARRRIEGKARTMLRGAERWARAIADRYFAKFGLTYDAWMASVGTGPAPKVAAHAREMAAALARETARLKEDLRARRARREVAR